jgi:DNA polymerase III sliding clamp (beta) subunit (PCNA family)
MRGSSGTVGVAVSYLIDAAQACGDRVEIGLGDETAPVRVDPALDTVNATCVVMPMRL